MNSNKFLKPCPICGGSQVCNERVLNEIELLRCQPCGFVYANLAEEQIKLQNSEFGESVATSYEEGQTLVDKLWFKMIVQKITSYVKTGSVLDVGCGNGVLLKNFLDKGWKASGVDLSPWAQKSAQLYGYKLYTCELEKSQLPDNCFDVVVSTSTLEHIPQPYLHVKEILRVVKPGGLAYFSGIPNYGSLPVRLKISDFRCNQPPNHSNYFTYGSMCKLFSSPQIADKVKTASVVTYGIPGLHKLYSFMRNAVRKTAKSSKQTVKNASSNNKSQLQQTSKSSLSMTAAKILIALNYHLGRFLHLGDKLEVMVIKRQ
jgi:2-polyprenyl-3-methyl-5-hydroxy-6-metoxy-1,4-benzoquinol methylase